MNDTPAAAPLLSAQRVSKIYADGHVAALVDVSLDVSAGEYLAIVGPSGSGKSTLLHLLGALDLPDQGDICFEGQTLARWNSLDTFRSQKIGFVFQSFHLLPTLTALENVQVPMFEGPLRAAQRQKRAEELLAAVAMQHRTGHLPSQLSMGERQRVAIARALANQPRALLADEPTGNLDSHTANDVLGLFEGLNQKGLTLIVVTHSAEVAERARRVVRIRDGRIVSDDRKDGK